MKLHKFDAISFVSGLFTAAVGLLFLIPAEPGDVFGAIGQIDEIGAWLWPTLLIAVGVLIIAPLIMRPNRESEEEAEL